MYTPFVTAVTWFKIVINRQNTRAQQTTVILDKPPREGRQILCHTVSPFVTQVVTRIVTETGACLKKNKTQKQ